MNGIHEVTGSTPVWSTNLRSPTASFGSVNQASLRQAKDAAPKQRSCEGGPDPVCERATARSTLSLSSERASAQ
jgi:hypothetical protein